MKTIKSKILVVTVTIVAVLSVAIIGLSFGTYANYKELQLSGTKAEIGLESEKVDGIIKVLEKNVQALAIMCGQYYEYYNALPDDAEKTEKEQAFGAAAVLQNFGSSIYAVGGGIWMDPLLFGGAYQCFYAFKDETGASVLDESFATTAYDYPTQSWYTAIAKGNGDIVWTAPYVDETGTNALMTTVGQSVYDSDGNFIGMVTVDWELEHIIDTLTAIRPTETSFVLFADTENSYILALTDKKAESSHVGEPLSALEWSYGTPQNGMLSLTVHGAKQTVIVCPLTNGMELYVHIPQNELFKDITATLIWTVVVMAAAAALIFLMMYWMLNRFVNRPVARLASASRELSGGNLNAVIPVQGEDELSDLAKTFNTMTASIREHIANLKTITAEKERIGAELAVATEIQASLLPCIFPAFPERKDFDIYATMQPAKEVGGDFYDFFLIDDTHLGVVIADVSGKGVPAALFMVIAKTIIKNYAQLKLSPKEVFEKTNAALCEGNDAGLFVTAFMGILDVETGLFTYVNAGHNPPFLLRAGGEFLLLKQRPNFILAGMENTRYKEHTLTLQKGDRLFLYTDGVTEAINGQDVLYGEDRLKAFLNNHKTDALKELLAGVKQDIDTHAEATPQFDDITMLAFTYTGAANTLTVPAKTDNLPEVLSFLEEKMETLSFPPAAVTQVGIAAEEVFVNIAHYAYPETAPGDAVITVTAQENPKTVTVIFEDGGTPYNPLEKETPDVTESPDARKIGGLGVFLVKKLMTSVCYDYADGKNRLTFTKVIE